MPTDPLLTVSDLNIRFAGYNELLAVQNLSFQLEKGKTTAIVGESGSGKSLTALAIIGLLPAAAIQTGSLELKGITTPQPVRGKDIGMVFQEPMSALNPVMKIGEQLTESILIHQKTSAKKARVIALDWLSRVQLPEPEKIFHRYPHQISGGQKQRVMIAMAMCNQPSLLIADEPTTALDVTVQQEILQLMQELQTTYKTSILFITHDLGIAQIIADKVLVMYQGKMQEYGDAQEVLTSPKHPYTRALLQCRPSKEHVGGRLPLVSDFLQPESRPGDIKLKESKPMSEQKREQEKLIEITELNIWYPVKSNWAGSATAFFKAVNNVNFHINKGEVLGLAGESGCGKSTIGRALVGLTPISSGSVKFLDYDLAEAKSNDWKQIRKKIQMVFQDPSSSLNPRLTVGAAIEEPLSVHRIVTSGQRKKEVLRLLDLAGLPQTAYDKYPHEFSGGQRQRIGIARALALKPELLICDESVSALDVSVQAQILNLMKNLQEEFGLTYLFISHDLAVIRHISDRVMIMNKGSIVESGYTANIFDNPQHPYTRKLLQALPEMHHMY